MTASTRARRITVDLSQPVAEELDRIRNVTGLKTADIFRHALSLLRVYVNAMIDGKELRVIDPADSSDQVRLVMPMQISMSESENLEADE